MYLYTHIHIHICILHTYIHVYNMTAERNFMWLSLMSENITVFSKITHKSVSINTGYVIT